eukprot:TRINITY_DN1803_c0_g1_i2.p1 TRINITY_DN1803_c0_g1~~TRINITY_DN1803_c0_g1_i2.p1  ORF type:complete len:232 (-),score=21.53 TRINITY_DN1803_c0_g1_i2:5-700(-)
MLHIEATSQELVEESKGFANRKVLGLSKGEKISVYDQFTPDQTHVWASKLDNSSSGWVYVRNIEVDPPTFEWDGKENVQSIWKKIHRELPSTLRNTVTAPLSDEEIDQLCQKHNKIIPSPIREWFRCHNGQDTSTAKADSIVKGFYRCISLQEAIDFSEYSSRWCIVSPSGFGTVGIETVGTEADKVIYWSDCNESIMGRLEEWMVQNLLFTHSRKYKFFTELQEKISSCC